MSLKIQTLIISFIFFIVGLLTLSHYGINWDTINHLPRGQVYLQYFLTGKKDFSDLPKIFAERQKPGDWYWQKPQSLLIDTDIPGNKINKISLYQLSGVNFDYFMDKDGGHPPLSDILSSVFNLVLFQKLGLINDIDSYRVYGVLLAASMVGLIFYWVSKVYGNFSGLVAAISLILNPLFWSEMHFNSEKDIPEAIFWGFLLFSIWKWVTEKKWKWILISGVFFGLSLGTKLNVAFIPFVILPWLLTFLLGNKKLKQNIKMMISLLVVPIIGIVIFFASWPFLWPDPIAGIGKVIGFYKTIGLTQNIDQRFLGPFGINTFAIQWILYTTPIVILILTFIGILYAIKRIPQEKDKISLLFLLWLAVPIARVSWPGSNIYGGVRQIMEYIPAMAILAGAGGSVVYTWLTNANRKFIAGTLVIIAFIPIFVKLIQIHPNENVYFNPLIGGLSGAKAKNFPFWGLSFGSPYRQAALWINANAKPNSNVVFAYELLPNMPIIWLRQDLNFHNSNRSGYLRKGEYAITLISQGNSGRSYYDMYLEHFLEPVYQVKVDGVAILKVWENDDQHLKMNWKEEEITKTSILKEDFGLRFDLGEIKKLSRLEISYNEENCNQLISGYVQISKNGEAWEKLPGVFPQQWLISSLGQQPKDGHFIEPFVSQEARFIDISLNPPDTCLTNIKSFKLYVFK